MTREAKRPPCERGLSRSDWGIQENKEKNMNYRHNKHLTPFAKQLRKNMTKEERHLWYDFLKDYPVRFLRQKVIDDYIVDFYCSRARLAIELDGSQHYEKEGLLKDKIRTVDIEKRDIAVVRIPNNEIFKNFEGVCEYIDIIVKKRVGDNK